MTVCNDIGVALIAIEMGSKLKKLWTLNRNNIRIKLIFKNKLEIKIES